MSSVQTWPSADLWTRIDAVTMQDSTLCPACDCAAAVHRLELGAFLCPVLSDDPELALRERRRLAEMVKLAGEKTRMPQPTYNRNVQILSANRSRFKKVQRDIEIARENISDFYRFEPAVIRLVEQDGKSVSEAIDTVRQLAAEEFQDLTEKLARIAKRAERKEKALADIERQNIEQQLLRARQRQIEAILTLGLNPVNVRVLPPGEPKPEKRITVTGRRRYALDEE